MSTKKDTVPVLNFVRRNLHNTMKEVLKLPISQLPKIRLKNLKTGTLLCVGVTSSCELSLFEFGEDPSGGFFIRTDDILNTDWVIASPDDEVIAKENS